MTTATPPPAFGLRLAAVRIEDFRALRDFHITFSTGTTVLVGENNSGKTSLLEALAVALGQRRPQLEDLFTGPGGSATTFQIDLRIEPTGGGDYSDSVVDVVGDAVQLETPEFFTVRVKGEVSAEGWEITIRRRFVKGWAADRAGAAALDELDTPPVGRQVLSLLHYDVLDARRDIVEQLRNRRTYWGRTTSTVSIAGAVRTQLEKQLRQLSEDVTTKSTVLSQVKTDLSALSTALSQGKLDVELEALPRSVDDLIRAMDIVITSPNSSTFPVGSQGMGTRSLAALLVFRSYVNVVRPRQKADRLLSVAAFEEPEAHLHPQSQRSVFELLGQIGGQRVVSTHSGHVASIAKLDSYRLFRRVGAETTATEIPATVRAAWNAEQVRRFVQVQNPEVLFAKAVGVVEGPTEAAAFPEFSRAHWGDRGADGVGVSLVCTGGAGTAKHIVPFLDSLGIPWVMFCDGDGAGNDGLSATGTILGRPLDRTSQEVVQLPPGQSFEEYVMGEGLGAHVQEAADLHPEGPFDRYKTTMHGQKLRGGGLRDYQSSGGDERACLDFMKHHKGTVGGLLARCINAAAAAGTVAMPSLITEFFKRLDAVRST